MASKPLHRRTFLRGAGSSIFTLPLLEIMLSANGDSLAATGDPLPGRFALVFGGGAVSTDADDGKLSQAVPRTVGPAWESVPALAPIIEEGLKSEVSLITGLKVPYTSTRGIGGTRSQENFHGASFLPQLNGATAFGDGKNNRWLGATIDQVIAASLGKQSRIPSLFYQAQNKNYLGGTDFAGRNTICLRKSSSGAIEPVEAQLSPLAGFRSLFKGAPTDANDPILPRRSVLDQVFQEFKRLQERVGSSDRRRLEQHMEAIRNLETRLSSTPNSCRQPAAPEEPEGKPGEIEARRTQIFNDLIVLAFACDLSRVGSILISTAQSRMPVPGVGEIHFTSHSGYPKEMASIIAWHLRVGFCDLLKKLKATPEAGGTLLDRTAVAYAMEAGWGDSYEASSRGSARGPHSAENVMLLLAGRVGGLKPGRHLAFGNREHPAKVMISAMKALGVGDTLNEVHGTLPELFGA